MRRVAMITALAMLLMMAAAPAVAQDAYPPPVAPTCAADVGSAAPGQRVTLVCSGWAPGEEVTISIDATGIDPIVLATVNADAAGNLRAAITIPSTLPPGPAIITVSGTSAAGQVGVLELSFNVVSATGTAGTPTTPVPGTGLPATGSEPGMALLTAFGLFAAGGTALFAARRRNALQAG